MGRYYGYNRVSTNNQNLERGNQAIYSFCSKFGFDLVKIYEDKQSGKSFNRPRYIVLKEDVLRKGDTLIIPEYDRLGRASETKKELEFFKENGIRVIFLDIPTTYMDFSNLPDEMSKMILECINSMLISFYDLQARTELERKIKRQREGIRAMKEKGEWERYGRPRIMSKDDFSKHYSRVVNGEIGSLKLMRELGLSHNTYFRYVREFKKQNSI